MEIKISVIMPVYNVESYLRQCMDSVVNQSLKEIEIICVDDGSTDRSYNILQEYAEKDERIILLQQRNQYAGVARNRGLERATGEYVIFWDADDVFELTALEQLFARAKEADADLCICNAQDFDSESGKKLAHSYLRKPLPEQEIFCIQDFPERIFTFTSTVTWNKLIRRNLMMEQEIRFQPLQHINDVLATLLVLSCAKRIVLLDARLIHYRMNRTGSLMKTYSGQNDAVFLAYENTEEALASRGILDDPVIQKSFLNKALGVYLFTMPYVASRDAFTEYYERMKESCEQLSMDQLLAENGIYSEKNAALYARMKVCSPEEYLFEAYRDTTQEVQLLKQKKNDLNASVKKLQTQKRKLQTQKKKLQSRMKKIEKENQERGELLERPLLRWIQNVFYRRNERIDG